MNNYDEKLNICPILSVNIAAINMKWLINFVIKNINNIKGRYICVSNVHTTVTAYRDENYRKVQNSSILSIPDGGPLASECRRRGFTDTERTTGPDFMNEILKISAEYGYKHYFYGSTNETLAKMKNELLTKYPKLNIVGMYSPPFRTLTNEENDDIIKKINESNADFLWVGLGAPKQEIFMYEHMDKINALMVGVGAAFDYFAGNIKRAPKIMQKLNLEWLYRLMQDPKKLFFRYVSTNFSFIWNAFILKK